MKKLLISFLLILISLLSYTQDEYYRVVDWKFYPNAIIRLTDSTYQMEAIPFDYNDPGAITRTVGSYVVDFIGHRYKVIDSTLTTITVLDIYYTGQAPQSLQIARCYRTVGNGEADYIGSVDYFPLDESARWKLNGSDNELLWRHGIEYESPFKREVLDTEYIIEGNEVKGTTYWDVANGVPSTVLGNSVVYQWGEELFIDGQNNTGSTLTDGTPVQYAGSIGNSGNFRISKAQALATAPAYLFVGILTHDTPNDSVGKITITGKVRGLQTNGANYGETWVAGDIVYVSGTTPGYLTKFPPQAPVPAIPVALVISAHANNGTLEVRPTFPQKLTELSDINGTPLTTTGQFPVWDNDRQVFDFNYNALNLVGGGGSATSTDTISQVSHGFSVGEAIYLDDVFYKANADTITTSDVIGIVIDSISADTFIYAYSGMIPGTYTEGQNYFLSNAVDGAVITEPIYNIGEIRQFIGTGQSDGSLLLEIDLGHQISAFDIGALSAGDTISSMYYSNDTLYITESGNTFMAEIVGGSGGGSATLYEKELTNNETVVNTGILLDGSCMVFVNGEIISSANWSGEGTTSVSLAMLINQYDNLMVYKSSITISSLFEAELALNQTTIDIGFTPNATTIIFFNGEALMSDKWTTTGTEITLLFPVSNYDKLLAKN